MNAADFGFSSTASALTNAWAIMGAYNALGNTYGGEIFLPRGEYAVASDIIKPITRNVRFRGDGPGMSYDGAAHGGTRLVFHTGGIGFDFTTWSGGSGGGYYEIVDMMLDGCDVTQKGIKSKGQIRCDNISVNNFGVGVLISEYCALTRLENFSINGCAGVGLLLGDAATGGTNTTFSAMNYAVRQNGVGVRIMGARGFSFGDGVIESNIGAGLHIYQAAGGQVSFGAFDNVWIEENRYSGQAGYQVVIDAETTGDYARNIKFRNCTLEATAPTDAINVANGAHIVFEDCDIQPGAKIRFGSNTLRCGVLNSPGAVIEDSGSHNWQDTI